MAEPRILASSGKTLSYVVEGATLRCSFGDKESKLQLPMDHKIYIKGKAQANIMDFKPMVNVQPFGKCSSLANPVVAAATAANHGRLQKMPCVPALTMPWLQGKTDERVDGFPALLELASYVHGAAHHH